MPLLRPLNHPSSPLTPLTPTLTAQALLAVKGALGVTFTTWGLDKPCTTASTGPAIEGTLTAVSCTCALTTCALSTSICATKTVVHLSLGLVLRHAAFSRFLLLMPIPPPPSLCIALTTRAPTACAASTCDLSSALGFNYLTGSLPGSIAAPLKALDVQFNFLAGSFPALGLAFCSARINCFASTANCKHPTRPAEIPRAAAACAICNTTNAQGKLCSNIIGGGICSVTPPSLLLPPGTPNSASSPVLPLVCTAATSVPMDATQAAALMNVKVALGVSFPDWRVDALCTLVGSPSPAPSTWNGVACDDSGKVLRVSLKGQGLTGSIHLEISKLTTLTVLDLQSNRLEGKMDAFTANIKAPLVLKELYLQYNYLYGTFPSALLALKTLSTLSVAFNYLTGSLPTALPTMLASLDVQSNFLAGSVPANSIPYCASTGNCLVDASKCASLGLPQRSAAECAVCGSTNGQGALCAAATSCRVAAAGARVASPPTALSASLPLFCEAVPMDLITTQTMVAIKAALGVTLTDWTATLPLLKPSGPISPKSLPRSSSVPLAGSLGTCTLEGQTPGPGAWTGVYCSSKGVAVGIHLQYNWFSSSIPSSLVALPVLSTLKLSRNYLTGTVPAFKTSLKALNVASNLLSGSFPIATLTACDARSNCLSSATNCANTAGTSQLAASECSVCGSTDASGVLCGGGLCAPDASAPAASSTPNTDGQPLLPLSCLGVPMDAAMGLALLSVKASLGVTFTDWNVDAPCALAGQAVVPGSWSSVVCDANGKVLTLELNNNLFSGRLDSFLTPLLPVKTLKVLHVHNNYLSGAMPPSLTAFSALFELKIQGNYLTGSMPAALPASLKYLDASGNYLCEGIAGSVVHQLGGELAVCRGGSGSTASKLSGQKLAGKMHSDISKLTTLTSIVLYLILLLRAYLVTSTQNALILLSFSHLHPPLLPPILSPLPSSPHFSPPTNSAPLPSRPLLSRFVSSQPDHLAHGSNFNFNWFAGSIPSALVGIASLTSFGASYNYLYGPVPKLGTALKTIDVQKNWLSGTFPGTGFLSCSASSNCLASTGASNTTGTTQRPLASCAVCDSPTEADPICAGGTCAPNTAGPLASSTTPTTSSPILLRFCVGVPLNAAQAAILLSVKTALGVTFIEWSASTLALSPKAKTLVSEFRNGLKAMGRRLLAESEPGRERVLLVASGQMGSCTIQGQTPVPGSWPCVFCSSAGMVVGLHPLSSCLTWNHHSVFPCCSIFACCSLFSCCSLFLCCSLFPCCSLVPCCSFCLCCSVFPCCPPAPLCVEGRDLWSVLLRGTVHADISKLTTLTALYLSSNLFNQRLDSFVAPILPTASLKELVVSFNWLYGSVPSKLVAMAALSNLRFSYNYLTGSLPKPGATLKILDTQANFLSGTFPTATLVACNARLNCFTDASACPSLDGTAQRPAAGCNMCGSPTKKQQGLCGGGTCLPIVSPSLAKVPNSAAAPMLPMACAAVPLDATTVAALLKVGAALGVRDTDWRNGSKCNIEGQTANFKTWPGVWCSANGTVLSITLPNKALRGIIHADISKLTALSYLDLSYNLFFGQLSKFVSNVLPLATVATLNLNSNYLYDSIPSALVNMPKLTELRLGANYLTGTLPAMATQLQVLAIASNLLAGAFPTQPFQLCDIHSNCLSSPGYCTNDAGVAQRTSGCAFCGSATGAPPFCAGTTCTPDVAARLAASTVNTPAAALAAMFCEAVPVDDNSALALLALRAGLGVSALSWAVDSPCTLAGNAPAVDSWTGVVCDLSGQHALCSMHALSRPNVASNLLDARMIEWALPLTGLKALKQLSLNNNWFSGPLPSFLLTMSSLSALNVQFNYLAGPITGTPSASLKSLNVASNLLTGTFPASSTTACDARSNCLADSSKCLASGSSSQRSTSDCNLCGAGSSSVVICNGGVCTPDTTAPVAALTPNSASDALLPMQCSGVRIDATAVSVLGSLKAALGVPLPDWGVNSLCTVVIVVSGVSSSSPGPRDLGGVLCSPAGAVVEINLNTRQLAGSMHADISKLTALTALLPNMPIALHLSPSCVPLFLRSPLPAFPSSCLPLFLPSPLPAFPSSCLPLFLPSHIMLLRQLIPLQLHYNYLFGPIPSALIGLKSLSKLSLGSNYLTGSVPVPGTAIKHLGFENNYLVGTFPTGSWLSCSALTNCFSSAAACTADGGKGTVQRTTCSICGSANGTGVLCGGGGASTCQPTAASLASLSTLNGPSTPALPMECSLLPAVPVNSTARWAANAVCTLAGTGGTVASGSLTGVECDSAGNPVKITLNNQQLFGVLPADVTKLTALTYLSSMPLLCLPYAYSVSPCAPPHSNLQSNLFRARLEDFAMRLPALTNLAVL
ncbi:unnamed protein product [Closterium sp. Naga37s-1]|nr:unnamed protein product [Closterium sp. Naga37s-1]